MCGQLYLLAKEGLSTGWLLEGQPEETNHALGAFSGTWMLNLVRDILELGGMAKEGSESFALREDTLKFMEKSLCGDPIEVRPFAEDFLSRLGKR